MCIEVALPKIVEAVKGTSVEQIIVVSPVDSVGGLKKAIYKLKQRLDKATPQYTTICTDWPSFIRTGKNHEYEPIGYEKDKCCIIVHTGGTTGTPKGVMLSNDNLNAASFQATVSPLNMQKQDKF